VVEVGDAGNAVAANAVIERVNPWQGFRVGLVGDLTK
jgi:hypothetical protein